MAGKLADIYGTDDTQLAESVASDALGSQDSGADIWGDTQDTARAQSYANVGRESLGPSDPTTPITRGQGAGNRENEALDMPEDTKVGDVKHRHGPRTSSDEGTGVKLPPKFHKQPGAGAGPRYAKKES